MSLNRADWCRVWESVKTIEHLFNNPGNLTKATIEIRVQKEIEFIKTKIQSVIGQME